MFNYTFYYKTNFHNITATSSDEALKRLREQLSAAAAREAQLTSVKKVAA